MLIQNTSSLAQPPTPTVSPLPANLSGLVAQPSASEKTPSSKAAKVVEKQAAAPQPTDAQLQSEINRINKVLQQSNRNLELSFSVDQTTSMQVVKLMDKATGETVLQYPSDAVLAIAQGIDEFQHGLLLKQKA